MSLQTNASAGKVGFATAYAIDKIAGIFQGSYISGTQTTTLGGYLFQYPIPHNFTRPVFTELLVSTDGKNYQDGGPSGASLQGIAYSDANNIYVTTSSATGTIYYKVIASWIDNYDTTNPSVTPILQNLTNSAFFDSRQNYQKVFIQGVNTVSTVNSDNLIPINHNLGYTPNAKIYFESVTGQVWPQIDGGAGDFWLYAPSTQAECYGIINKTQLNIDCFIPASGTTTRVWWRIYLDGS